MNKTVAFILSVVVVVAVVVVLVSVYYKPVDLPTEGEAYYVVDAATGGVSVVKDKVLIKGTDGLEYTVLAVLDGSDTCTDSDGFNTFVKGNVQVNMGGSPYIVEDNCTNPNFLEEMVCGSDIDWSKNIEAVQQLGLSNINNVGFKLWLQVAGLGMEDKGSCVDGVVVWSCNELSDSDGGPDRYRGGRITCS